MMRVSVIGTGYVGLVSGACLADFGHEVTCVDVDREKIAHLRRGEIPIFEPGLDLLVSDNLEAGRLRFADDLAPVVAQSDVVFIAVGTPSRRGDGHADTSYVREAAASIAAAVDGFTVIVTKSTVPVGTGDEVEQIVRTVNPRADVAVVSNPEFLREGSAIEDFKHPDRIIVGAHDERARRAMVDLYRPLCLGQTPIVMVDRRSAELIKYAANAFLAMKVTFINEIADLCERTGANVQDVKRGVGLDGRIGMRFLNPGPGYGGSCFPKDTVALLKTAKDYDSPLGLVEATVLVNEQRKRAMGLRIIAAAGGDVRGKVVGLLGLTFKPDTDDMREAPSLAIIQCLHESGAHIRAYDPQGMETARMLVGDIAFVHDAYEVAEGADCLVLVTEWNAFRSLDLGRIRSLMRTPVLVDLHNVYRRSDVETAGLSYNGVGWRPMRPSPQLQKADA